MSTNFLDKQYVFGQNFRGRVHGKNKINLILLERNILTAPKSACTLNYEMYEYKYCYAFVYTSDQFDSSLSLAPCKISNIAVKINSSN